MYKELKNFLFYCHFFFWECQKGHWIQYLQYWSIVTALVLKATWVCPYFGSGLLVIIYQRDKVHSLSRTRMPLVPSSMKSYDAGFVSFIGIVSLFHLDDWLKRTSDKNVNLGLKLTQSLCSLPLINLKQLIDYNSAKPVVLIGLKV